MEKHGKTWKKQNLRKKRKIEIEKKPRKNLKNKEKINEKLNEKQKP